MIDHIHTERLENVLRGWEFAQPRGDVQGAANHLLGALALVFATQEIAILPEVGGVEDTGEKLDFLLIFIARFHGFEDALSSEMSVGIHAQGQG